MKEPTTVEEAIDLTLRKIEESMALPRHERKDYWGKTRWDYSSEKRYCAFCIVAENSNSRSIHNCICIAKDICLWFCNNINKGLGGWLKKDLRKLYKMVEEVEG